MWPFRRRRGPATAEYTIESTPVQLRIMRSHIGAMTSELANVRHEIQRLVDVVDRGQVGEQRRFDLVATQLSTIIKRQQEDQREAS